MGKLRGDRRLLHQWEMVYRCNCVKKDVLSWSGNALHSLQAILFAAGQTLLMDIPAEPCPQSSSHPDCDILQQLQDSALKDNFLENSQGIQDNISQPPETKEPELISDGDTLSFSPVSPLLSFSQKKRINWCMPGPNYPTLSMQAPINQLKNGGPHNHQRLLAQPKPSFIGCRHTKNNW